ncbi:hypothetical protein WDU94_001720, partial [Cyamophila willieti]
ISALIVRFLTRRYIGEYDHQSDSRYKGEVLVDGDTVLFEILDTCPKSIEELPSRDTIHWADGILLVYAITDRESFNYVRRVRTCADLNNLPLVLVGNKEDMIHLRQVSTEEGEILGKDFDCSFEEVAAAEQVTEVAELFTDLAREVLSTRRKTKQSLLERMLGNKSRGGNKNDTGGSKD